MFKNPAMVVSALLCTLSCTGCPTKPVPTSTITTRTQTTASDSDGGHTASDVTEKRTEQADGTKKVETTTTTTTSTPPPKP